MTVAERIAQITQQRLNSGAIPEPNYATLPLTLEQWRAREIPALEFLLGSVFTTTTRAMLSADTGLGKTHVGFALGFAMSAGKDFCHWRGHKQARVLIVDGEMPRGLVKERLGDAERRLGTRPPRLHMLCREDVEDMLPLDMLAGQQWLDGLIEYVHGVDFLILDNAMSLTISDLKDEEAWRPVNDWMRSLTRRRIGVLWINHTGHDATRAYGTKTREWQMDVVMLGERIKDPDADIAIHLSFPKARQRKPDNSLDFEPVILQLLNDRWEAKHNVKKSKRAMSKDAAVALQTLREAIEAMGQPAPNSLTTKAVTSSQWRNNFYRSRPLVVDDTANDAAEQKAKAARRKAFQRARDYLEKAEFICRSADWYWPQS